MSTLEKREHGAIDMTQGNPTKLILAFSIPLLLGNIFQQFYNMVDSMVVGRYVGSTALAAVGIGFPIIFLLSSLFIGLGMGATVMIAQYIGAGDQAAVGRTVETIYSALLVITLPLTIAGILLSEPLLLLIRVPPEVLPEARIYTMVVFAGVVGTLGYNVNAGIMQGLGDSKTPLLFLAIACVINVVLDLLFVLVFQLDVFGVALATILAQAASWLFGIFYINRKYPFIRIRIFQFKTSRVLLRQIVHLGVPSAIQQGQFAVAILMMQTLINSFGKDFAAGFAAANKIDTFVFMPIMSFATAATTFVGQNMGAGRLDRVKQGTRATLVMSIALCSILAALVLPFQKELLSLFNGEPAVVAAGEAYLTRVIAPMPVFALMFVLNSVLRGAGCTMVPMIASIVALWLARVPAAYLLAHFLGPEQLYWSYLIGWILGVGITGVVYLRGRWKERCIVLQP